MISVIRGVREWKKGQKFVKMSRDFKYELKEFFTSGAREQFLAETMVINWVTEDFKKSEFKDTMLHSTMFHSWVKSGTE